MHVVELEDGQYSLLSQAGLWVPVNGEMTIAQLIARGLTVRVHQSKRAVDEEDFKP